MKVFSYFLFGFLVTCKVHGQNCQRLDSTSFFTSIKFGDQIPADLASCSKKSKIESPYYGILRTKYDSLTRECKKKYTDLFTFQSTSFSFSQVSTNKSGQILTVELYSFFNDNRTAKEINYGPPPDFIRIYRKLESLYGKPAIIQEPTKTDSLFIKEKGMPWLIAWYCNTINLQLRVNYGAREEALNVLHIQITNREFDIVKELELLQ